MGGWRKGRKGELYDLYTLPNINWVNHIEVYEMTAACSTQSRDWRCTPIQVLIGKREGKSTLGKSRCR